jgi:serine/threonine protein kinase/WD40 repeat protein
MADETETEVGKRSGGEPRPSRELPTIAWQHYELGAEIAHGGMGRIRTARDLRLGREVAIKELLEPRGTSGLRFEREALVTARLQHPNIVAVYEAGRWPSGEPFYAMKLVHGRSLKKVIAEAETFDARLALLPHVLAVADAMAYAHEQRIVHRDLKPSNVLVGEFGETVVIDWGLAKDLMAADVAVEQAPVARSSDPSLTRTGSVMGTPNYMPPEQARGEPIDERADVYAIGAMLYHLLAGTPPYLGDDSERVLSTVVSTPPQPLAERARGAAPDLLAIADRAMARDPSVRYPSARELAEDLRRFQMGRLVASHRYTRLQLLRRFVRRHRVPLSIAAVAIAILASLGVYSIQRIRDQRDEARAERARADEQKALAEKQRAIADQRTDERTVDQAAEELDRDPLGALLSLDRIAPHSAMLPAARVVAADILAHHVPMVADVRVGDVTYVDFTADGKLLAIASGDHTVSLVDLSGDEPQVRTLGRHDDRAEHVAIADDTSIVASSGLDGRVRVWDRAGHQLASFEIDGEVVEVEITRDGSRVMVDEIDGRFRIYDVAKRAFAFETKDVHYLWPTSDTRTAAWFWQDTVHVLDLASYRERTVRVGAAAASAFSTDTRHFAFVRPDGTIAIADLDSGRVHEVGRSPARVITALAFVPDGGELLSLAEVGELRAWPSAGGSSRLLGRVPVVGAEPEPEGGLLVAPDGKSALTMSSAATHLWDLDTGDATPLLGPHYEVSNWRFSPDGARVYGFAGHELWMWPTRGDQRVLARQPGTMHQVAYTADGRSLAASEHELTIAGEPRLVLPEKLVGRLALTTDRARAAMLGEDGVVRVIELGSRQIKPLAGTLAADQRYAPADPALTKTEPGKDGKTHTRWVIRRYVRTQRDHKGWFDPVVFSRDGAQLAGAGTHGGKILVWSLATGAARELDAGDTDIEQLAFTPDGATLVAACGDGKIRVFPASGQPRVLVTPDPIEAIALSPDGRMLASAGVDHRVRLWELATGAMQVRRTYDDIVTAIAFSPDGHWLAAAVQDKTVELDSLIEQRHVSAAVHRGLPTALAFAPDGNTLVTGDDEGGVQVYDLAAGRGRALHQHGSAIGDVAISPDGKHVASAGEDGIAREWLEDVPRDEDGLRYRFRHPWR